MKAFFLVKNGSPQTAFQLKEQSLPKLKPNQVTIEAEGFGLNYADIMARKGLYQDCPPLPTVIGYDVVGKILEVGNDVQGIKIGDRVAAMTRFGGYSTHVQTDYRACAVIPEHWNLVEGTSLTTQGCTAHFCAEENVRLHEGDWVLVHAAAGGVGSIIVQIAKHYGCKVIGTVGSDEKFPAIQKLGVDFPINYRKKDWVSETEKIAGKNKIHAIFDMIGGEYVRKGFKLLNSGGTLVTYGAAEMTNKTNIFTKIPYALSFGFYHPIQFLVNSKNISGLNMLRIAENRPELLANALKKMVEYKSNGIIQNLEGHLFPANDLAKAHELLESRKSLGKIAVKW